MKVYRQHEPIAPIQVDLRAYETPNEMSPWVIGPVVIGFGVLLVMPHSPFGPPTGESATASELLPLYGFGSVLILAGVSILSKRIPSLARFGTRHPLSIAIAFIAAVFATFGPVTMKLLLSRGWPAGLLFLFGFSAFVTVPLWLLQRRNARQIAAEMHAPLKGQLAPVPVETPAKAALAEPGELVIEFYERADLPSVSPLQTTVSDGANIVGRSPVRLLYLYNFFADAMSEDMRPLAAWRLYGPTMMLASPIELARAAGYKLDLPRAIESQLLLDREMIATRVQSIGCVPLPPHPASRMAWYRRIPRQWLTRTERRVGITKRPALPENFANSGAYREEVLLCTDQTWQQGVLALTACAQKAIMEANDFTSERRGLVWEIEHLLNHFATRDFVVLVNSFTDLPALAEEFRQAWQKMDASSPNNHAAESRLRIVLLYGDDCGGFADDRELGRRALEFRDWERINAHHGVMALLCDE